MSTEWAEDDDFPSMPRPSGDHALSCDSGEWLKTHGTESELLRIVLKHTQRDHGVTPLQVEG